MTRSRTLKLSRIRVDDAIQARVCLCQQTVTEYAGAIRTGAQFPPVTVFDDGTSLWLADGFHRVAAARQAQLDRFATTVRPGTSRDAILHAVGANAAHGLRRTNADKRKAVTRLLDDPEWCLWSDREIARRAGVSNRFVGTVRKELTADVHSERRYVTKHGTVATMRTKHIGRRAPTSPCPSAFLDTVLPGNAEAVLPEFPDGCVDMVLTSPPYWGLRDYGTEGQIGGEPTFKRYIDRLAELFDEVRRVLKDTGTCWIVMGDVHSGSNNGSHDHRASADRRRYRGQKPGSTELPDKCLLQLPSRLAIALCERGWILRNELIWHKPNSVPASVRDRFTVDFEKILFFSKAPRYYFNQQYEETTRGDGERNRRSVWTIATESSTDGHLASFPTELLTLPISAGSPLGGIILDPFMGSGTTAAAAQALGRRWIGIELCTEYVQRARRRVNGANPPARNGAR